MENKKINIEQAKKFLENQRIIKRYLKGEITKKQLDDKGIKLAMPI